MMKDENSRLRRVPEAMMADLEAQIGKLNRRAAKLGVPPISVKVVGDAEIVTVVRKGGNYPLRVVQVQVGGEAPVIDGWRFVARISPGREGSEGNIVRGEDVPVRYWYGDAYRCDHCGTSRTRKYTYIIQSAWGEYKQVGKSCLRDFMGHTDPERVADWFTILTDQEFIYSYEIPHGAVYTGLLPGEDNPDARPRYCGRNVSDYLPWVVMAIRVMGGYRGRKNADYGQSTADVADQLEWEFRKNGGEPPTAEDCATARAAQEWAKTFTSNSLPQYAHNVRSIAKSNYAEHREEGTTASIIACYNRAQATEERQKRETERRVNEYFGNIKDRPALRLTLKRIREFDGGWGITTLNSFEDAEGRVFVWWTSSSNNLEEGNSYQVRGTIKAHQEYHGIKQTVLSRCRCES